MSSASASDSERPSAPWRDLFLQHIDSMKSPEFSLSTVRQIKRNSQNRSDPEDIMATPRVRTCIFRGMWASLPVNPKNPAELNPQGMYESDLVTFTTDVRMSKMGELWGGLFNEADGGNEKECEEWMGSGGGALVEGAWWAEEPMVQWRIRGKAYVLGPDIEESENGRKTREMLRAWMRWTPGSAAAKGDSNWSFAGEVTAHFGNLSPGMRGSFRNPSPGTPINLPVEDGLGLGQKVTDLHDSVARKNFRVVVVVPHEVDRTDLSDPERGRRWVYHLVNEAENRKSGRPGGVIEGDWEKVEVWP